MGYFITEALKQEFEKVKEVFENNQRFVIISHRGPDGDAVGTNVALKMALEKMGKFVVSACVDAVPHNSIFLKGADEFVRDFEYEDFDVIVTVDCAARQLIVFPETKPEMFTGPKPFVNFDHHITNDDYGTVNPVDAEACSTAIIMFKFFKYLKWHIDVDMATALLHGIYFDTGSLMHSNTDEEVLMACGELQAKGANVKKVAKELFHTTEVNKLRLWGRILERAYVNEEGVTVSAVTHEDYTATGTTPKDTGGAIDYLNAVPGAKYCVLLSADNHGRVKGSLRTQRDDVNLSDIAGQWGGGGHPKASGFGMEGQLKPVMSWKVVKGDEGEGEMKLEF